MIFGYTDFAISLGDSINLIKDVIRNFRCIPGTKIWLALANIILYMQINIVNLVESFSPGKAIKKITFDDVLLDYVYDRAKDNLFESASQIIEEYGCNKIFQFNSHSLQKISLVIWNHKHYLF